MNMIRILLLPTDPVSNEKSVELHPDFPIISGRYQMTENWSVELQARFNRRIEDGSLVIWRPGFTIWTTALGNDKNETVEERLNALRFASSADAFDAITESHGDISYYSYRLNEKADDNRNAAFYCFAIGDSGHVMMAIYFDDADDISAAESIWRSLSQS